MAPGQHDVHVAAQEKKKMVFNLQNIHVQVHESDADSKQATSTSQQGILTHVMSRNKEIVMWEQEHFNHPHKA